MCSAPFGGVFLQDLTAKPAPLMVDFYRLRAQIIPMTLAHRNAWISPKDYLELERQSDVRHEYFAGEMFAMAGAGTVSPACELRAGTRPLGYLY